MYRANSLLLPLALLCAAPLFAQPKWITMQNENFRVYSSAGERDTRDALDNLERVRGFFIQFTGAAPQKPVPISVVIFGSEKEFQPYKVNEFAIAYYSGQSDRDFIVIGKLGNESAQIATHEYTHLVMKHAGYVLPPWLNEGMAELFSTLKPIGGSTEFGNIIPGRLQALNLEPWAPLEAILTADRNSPYYNESKRAGNLYNQSWALVHMLMTSTEYRAKFWDVLKLVQDGVPSVQALEKVYGMPLPKLESTLKAYVSGDGFRRLITKIKLEGIEKLPSQPADMFQVRTIQAELLMNLRDKQSEAKARFEELTREDAKQPAPWSSLGYLAWRDGKTDLAIDNFAKSFELGNRNAKLLLDYARLAYRSKPEGSIAAYNALIELEPKNVDHRLDLTGLHMNQRNYPEALAAAKTITSVKTVEQRDRLLYMRAFAAMQTGDREDARARAEELKRVSTSPEFGTRADDILRFLNQPQRAALAAPVARPPVVPAESGPPKLTERESQPATRADMEIILQDIQGTLVEMDCKTPPTFVLATEGGLKRFIVLQPERLIVTGRTGGAEFACGLQKPVVPIRLQYTIAPEGSNTDGVVRAVHFGETK